MKEFIEMAEGYEPCDPNSEPGRKLRDYIMEPVDQWLLEQGAVEASTVEAARDVWVELGQPVIDADPEEIPDHELEVMEPDAVRQVQPATVKQFAEKLQPMIFEGLGLASIPLGLLAQIESDPVIIGQMFGVPRDGGYAPILVLTTTISGGPERCVDQLHGIMHLLNDIYGDNPEEIQVMM